MNPFTDWKPEQQTHGRLACNSWGDMVDPFSPSACKWCASGWLQFKRVDRLQQFGLYLTRSIGVALTHLNDEYGWTPEQFAAEWDKFEREAK